MPIILGVDPGTAVMGMAVIETIQSRVTPLEIRIERMAKTDDHPLKLREIFEKTVAIINQFQPEILAVEAPFYGKNPQSMLKLGRAQGVVIAAAMHHNLQVFEYSPRKIKMSITGNGNASKEQVAAMLQHMQIIKSTDKYPLDATDALAAAMCHHLQGKLSVGKTQYNNWSAFLSQNSDRIIK